MAPERSMTGETFAEKPPQSPASPADTDNTLRGDAIIEIQDDGASTRRISSSTTPSVSQEVAEEAVQSEKQPGLIRRVTKPFRSVPEPLDVTEINTRKLENTPQGFPRLAAFQASEPNFGLYRSFSYLHARLLLDLQDEITCLERELDEIDWDDYDESPARLKSREIDIQKHDSEIQVEPQRRTRRVILCEIKAKLMGYDEVLIKARQMESFQKPSERNYRSVRRYYHNTKPLMDSEMDSIRSKEDTVSLRNGREWSNFDGSVEKFLGDADQFFQRIFKSREPPLSPLFRTQELREKTDNQYIHYYSPSKISKLVNFLITFVIFVLLIVPVITMYRLTNKGSHDSSNSSYNQTFNAVGVLIVFTLLFSAAMSALTKAARHELFAASAAYCAILVVFIGNFTGTNN